jgi:hypothetical protein
MGDEEAAESWLTKKLEHVTVSGRERMLAEHVPGQHVESAPVPGHDYLLVTLSELLRVDDRIGGCPRLTQPPAPPAETCITPHRLRGSQGVPS